MLRCYASSAQHNILKNSGFEEWDSIPGARPYWEPRGYVSKNSVFQTSNRIYSFRSTDSHSGNYSLLLTPAIDSSSFSENIHSPNSWLVYDSVDISTINMATTADNLHKYHPLPSVPKRLCGWYKYVPDTTTPILRRRNGVLSLVAAVKNTIVGMPAAVMCGYIGFAFTEFKDEFTYFCADYIDDCNGAIPTEFSFHIQFPSKNLIQEPAGKLWLDDLVLEVEPTSVASVEERMLTLYPNPGKDVLYLHSNELLVSHIVLYDMHGSKVLQQKDSSQPLQVQHLAPGVYNLRCKVGKHWLNRRWVKE
jgi:hypothetical protein